MYLHDRSIEPCLCRASAEYWLETGADLPADLYEDEGNIVNWLDLEVFVDEWLNYCPYDWPLR
jgi:hypothetical protein